MAERDYVVASKVGEVSQLLYPDIHSTGGLVGLVRRWFESLDPEARVTGISATEENRWCAASARVDVQDRFSQIHVADKQRLFLVDFWAHGVYLANGAFKQHEIAAQAICCWTRERVGTKELASRFPDLSIVPKAAAFEEGREVDEEWKSYLEKPRPGFDAIIRAAAAQPELRMLFPFTSHLVLCFSRCTGYPYTDDCPMIAPAGSGRYQVMLRNGTTSPPLGAEDAVRLVIANLPPGCGPAVRGTAGTLRA